MNLDRRTVRHTLVAFAVVSALAVTAPALAGGHRAHGLIAIRGQHLKWRDGSPVENGGVNYPSDIYVVDVASGRVRNLTRDERSEYCSSWLPHGRGILFESVPSDRMKAGPTYVDVVSASGRRRRRLVSLRNRDYFGCPALSPDRGRVAYVIESGRRRGLYVMRIDGTQKQRLTSGAIAWALSPSWSPDGRQILFSRTSGRRRAEYGPIYVINADGSGLRRLTRTKALDPTPVWSPDGDRIAFVGGDGLVHTMRPDGTHLTRLSRDRLGQAGSGPFWMSDDRVVYRNGLDDRWYTVAADGSMAPRLLPPSTRGGRYLLNRPGDRWFPDPPVLSPGGRWIAWSRSTRAGTALLWISHEDGTERHLVTRLKCCYPTSLDWAPR